MSWAKNILTIGFSPEFATNLELVNTPRTITVLETKLHEMGYANAHVKFMQTEAPAPGTAPVIAPVAAPVPLPAVESAKPAPPSEPSVQEKTSPDVFKNDPLVKKALELFKGTIVTVGS
jgi:hypothetical protein